MTPERVKELRRKAEATFIAPGGAALSREDGLELVAEVERLHAVVASLGVLALAAVPPAG